jgi:glutaminyl-tRNA synthetase
MFTVMSKRKLKRLVDEGHVSGWDDPRMPTLTGMRRRGYTPEAIRDFISRVGVSKNYQVIELGSLENSVREDLNERAPRRFAVLKPLKLVIENYPEDREELMEAANHPNRPELGSRTVPFCREIYIEQEDFREDAPKKFYRLVPGGEVRLRYGYIIKCERVVKDAEGRVTELRCSYDPATRSGSAESQRKVKGTVHWVSARHAFASEVRLYDRLFKVADPDRAAGDLRDLLNPESLEIIAAAMLEPGLADAAPGERFQFERQGYFVAEAPPAGGPEAVFSRTVTLRDSWAKLEQQALAESSAAT